MSVGTDFGIAKNYLASQPPIYSYIENIHYDKRSSQFTFRVLLLVLPNSIVFIFATGLSVLINQRADE